MDFITLLDSWAVGMPSMTRDSQSHSSQMVASEQRLLAGILQMSKRVMMEGKEELSYSAVPSVREASCRTQL